MTNPPAVPDPVERWKEARETYSWRCVVPVEVLHTVTSLWDAGDALSAEVLRLRQENDALQKVIGIISEARDTYLDRAEAAERERDRYFAALIVAGQMCDGINGVDLHEEAYHVLLERADVGPDDEPDEACYAEAFCRATEWCGEWVSGESLVTPPEQG